MGKILKRAKRGDFTLHKSVRNGYKTFARAIGKLEALSAKLTKEAERKA